MLHLSLYNQLTANLVFVGRVNIHGFAQMTFSFRGFVLQKVTFSRAFSFDFSAFKRTEALFSAAVGLLFHLLLSLKGRKGVESTMTLGAVFSIQGRFYTLSVQRVQGFPNHPASFF
jgi:hypothetical protein